MKITAKQVCGLLATKHAKDVFVSECKTGSSWGRGAMRLDGWAMKRSWSPVTTIGYEIKVSRQDFLGDRKWEAYLPNCHEFYFVTPKGVCEKEELPEGIGLMWVSNTGTRLYTKRKAVRKEPDAESLVDLMTYVIMSRSRIAANMYDNPDSCELHWQDWLAQKKENRELGYRVSKAIREHVNELERTTRLAESRVRTYESIRSRMVELGLDPDDPIGSYSVKHTIDDALCVIPSGLVRSLRDVARDAKETADALAEMEKK